MTVRILLGDVREKLAELADELVHCVVTSPPYFGLRDYGTASWAGGDPACDHKASNYDRGERADRTNVMERTTPFKAACGRCGATRTDRQIGLEPTPAEFVAVMVEVFREVRRVLRKDGTLWLNLGDSYAGHNVGDFRAGNEAKNGGVSNKNGVGYIAGLKPKDLIGIPWRVAFALQADGWYLRQDIIWSKPNPMPESVTDRCTKAHEYLFLLSKSPRYHYDAEAIAEAVTESTVERLSQPTLDQQQGSDRVPGKTNGNMKAVGSDGTRNRRSVWTVATQPYAQAHFATFPPDLIEPCILAGCPKGGTVLDPFGGAGTTGLVADRLQRNAILIELNPAYAAMAESRIMDDAPLFVEMNAGSQLPAK